MNYPIQTICSLTGCSEEEANAAYDRTEDVVEAVDLLLAKSKTTPIQKRLREITPEEEIIGPIRKLMKKFDEERSTSSGQHGYEGSVEKLDLPEEKALQNNCVQECQIPVQESKVQKQETVCQLQSGCSCDSQLRARTLPCSDQECSQLNLLQEMESLEMGGQITVVVPLHEQSLSLPIEVDFANQLHILPPASSQNYHVVLSLDSQEH
jgi:hypothetical protein